MASTNFTYTPTTGSQTTSISVYPTEFNNTRQNKVATATFTNGTASTDVVFKQKYVPYRVSVGATTIPQTGGTIYYSIHTEYDIVFRSVPEWLTITQGNNTFVEGQRIPAISADGKTFGFSAGVNTGQTEEVHSTFNMGHYIGNTLQQRVEYFDVVWAGAVLTPKISLSPLFFDVSSAATSCTVHMTVENCTFDYYTTSSAGYFTIVAAAAPDANNDIQLTFPANNTFSSRFGKLSFYMYDTSGNGYTATIDVTQAAAGGIVTDVNAVLFEYNEYNASSAKTFTVLTADDWTSGIEDDD